MHELSITEALLTSVLEYAKENNASQVSEIHLKIGRLSSIFDDAVSFYWKMISEDTICANAKLIFQYMPGKFQCQECNCEFEIEKTLTPCPNCASYSLKTIGGKDFLLDSIEIEINK